MDLATYNGSYPILFRPNGSEAVRITANKNLLVGTTTDSQRLHVYNDNGASGYKTAFFNSNDTSNGTRVVIGNTGNTSGRGLGIMVGGNFAGTDKASFGWFNTDNTYAAATIMTITSDSNILMGGTDVYGTFENSSTSPRLQVRGTDLNGSCQAWIRATADAGAPKLFLANTRNTSANTHTVVQDGDELGGIFFTGSDGSQFVNGAGILSYVSGSPGADDVPGYLSFQTNNGSAAIAERMRLTSDGKLCVATTSTTSLGSQTGASNVSTFNQSGITLTQYSVTAGFYYDRINYTNSQYYIVNSSGTGVYLGNGSTSWSAHSDERLKTNIIELDGTKAYNHVKTARAASFKWNATGYPTDNKIGFIAQDWETNYPEVVNSTTETIDGVENPKGIQYTETVPVLMAALKQAIAKIETLEAEVAALKGS